MEWNLTDRNELRNMAAFVAHQLVHEARPIKQLSPLFGSIVSLIAALDDKKETQAEYLKSYEELILQCAEAPMMEWEKSNLLQVGEKARKAHERVSFWTREVTKYLQLEESLMKDYNGLWTLESSK